MASELGNKDVSVSMDGYVATVVMHRPPNNFLDIELIGNLASVLEGLDDVSECRSIVLAAEGKHFCAGANLQRRIDDEASGRPVSRTRHLYHEARRLVQTRKPIVAAVHGSAIGAGLGLALVCDFRVACQESRLACNFAALGYHPGFGMTATLPRVVGHQMAKWLAFTGRRLPGDEALKVGLIDRLVDQDKVLATAQEMAAELATIAPLSLQKTRESMNFALIAEFRAATEREAFEQNLLRETNDFKEGVKASSERRAPKFTGT
jgi:enoyl-CoA hydratase/carnithine racemase